MHIIYQLRLHKHTSHPHIIFFVTFALLLMDCFKDSNASPITATADLSNVSTTSSNSAMTDVQRSPMETLGFELRRFRRERTVMCSPGCTMSEYCPGMNKLHSRVHAHTQEGHRHSCMYAPAHARIMSEYCPGMNNLHSRTCSTRTCTHAEGTQTLLHAPAHAHIMSEYFSALLLFIIL